MNSQIIPVVLPPVAYPSADFRSKHPQLVKAIREEAGSVLLTSREKEPGGTPFGFTINIKGQIVGPIHISPQEFDGLLSVPNVNIRMNEVAFRVLSDGILRVATVPPGFYSVSRFLTALNTAMNAPAPALPGGVAITLGYNVDTTQTGVVVVGDQIRFEACKMSQRGIYFLTYPTISAAYSAAHVIPTITGVYTPRLYVYVDDASRDAKIKNWVGGTMTPFTFSLRQDPPESRFYSFSATGLVGANFAMNSDQPHPSFGVYIRDVFNESPDLYTINNACDWLDVRMALTF